MQNRFNEELLSIFFCLLAFNRGYLIKDSFTCTQTLRYYHHVHTCHDIIIKATYNIPSYKAYLKFSLLVMCTMKKMSLLTEHKMDKWEVTTGIFQNCKDMFP